MQDKISKVSGGLSVNAFVRLTECEPVSLVTCIY